MTLRWRGLPLHSPTDFVVGGDGSIWFVDRPSRRRSKPRPVLKPRVYRLDPLSNELFAVADGIARPNGLTFSHDESVLYVGDGRRRVFAYDVDRGFLRNPRLVARGRSMRGSRVLRT
jgi:sugar lactone lactonase YvrE